MNVRIWGVSNVGLVRTRNEDAFGVTGMPTPRGDGKVAFTEVQTAPLLIVVADGLGGHPCGHIASSVAVRAVLDAKPGDAWSLIEAGKFANRQIVDAMNENDGSVGMGSTIVAMLIYEGGIAIANVGDSQAFEFINSRFVQLTTDDVAGAYPGLSSSVLTQSLGGGARLRDIDVHLYEDNDLGPRRFLLCTDGLTSYVPNSLISTAASTRSGLDLAQALISLALEAGGSDNVTVVVIESSGL